MRRLSLNDHNRLAQAVVLLCNGYAWTLKLDYKLLDYFIY